MQLTRHRALEVLGLQEGFTPEQLKAAWRQYALKNRADNGEDPTNFILGNEAYKLLGSAKSDARYEDLADSINSAFQGLKGVSFNVRGVWGSYVKGTGPDPSTTEAFQDVEQGVWGRGRSTKDANKDALKREAVFQGLVIGKLKSGGAFTFNVHGHAMQKAGVPDLYVAHPKFQGWLEFKVDPRKLEAIQKHQIKELCLRSAPAFVMRLTMNSQTVVFQNYREEVFWDPIAFRDFTNMSGDDLLKILQDVYVSEAWK